MRALLASLALLLSACTHPDASGVHAAAPLPAEGKSSAPVTATVDFTPGHAKVVVTFERAATGVSVSATGLDGLAVAGTGVLLEEGKLGAGEARSWTLDLTPGPGRSALALHVKGVFQGAPASRVMTFSVGEGALPQSGTTLHTSDGDAIKLMPQ